MQPNREKVIDRQYCTKSSSTTNVTQTTFTPWSMHLKPFHDVGTERKTRLTKGNHGFLVHHATTQTEHQVQSGLLLDIVVRKGTAVLKLLAREDQALLAPSEFTTVVSVRDRPCRRTESPSRPTDPDRPYRPCVVCRHEKCS